MTRPNGLGCAGSSASRRTLYRQGKRVLIQTLNRSWNGPRNTLEPAVRRFLRARSRGYLSCLARGGAFALAAAVCLLATPPAGALPPIELADIADGIGGFIINGATASDQSGVSVSGAGDVNGDGLADVVVGASQADAYGNFQSGESYVVFGKGDGTPVDLADFAVVDGGFAISGIDPEDSAGASVSGGGDINGDDLDDVIVGAYKANGFAGESYVIFGKDDGAAVDLADVAAGSFGYMIMGIDPLDACGFSVSIVGDVNGDGLADVIIGAYRANKIAGESYVVFGKSGTDPVNLTDVVAGIGGFVINGIDPGDQSGRSVSGAGDVNGDGLADVIIGARRADPGGVANAGESYVVFGKATTAPVNLADVAAGKGGYIITGIDNSDEAGYSVSGAGDVNGDGLDDVIVGARYGDGNALFDGGESYVVFGKADGTPVDLVDITAGNGGFVINGIDSSDRSGHSVSGAGDVNGDGLADVIVGAYRADPAGESSAGESYVVFGKADTTPVNLADIVAGSGGFAVLGTHSGDRSGFAVAGAGDVDGDGMDDLIIGAYGATAGGQDQSGETYVVFSPVLSGDLNGDGMVGSLDYGALLGSWGPCAGACPPYCPGDLDGDCQVGIVDFLLLLSNWTQF